MQDTPVQCLFKYTLDLQDCGHTNNIFSMASMLENNKNVTLRKLNITVL